MLGIALPVCYRFRDGTAHVECGGLPPLFSGEACLARSVASSNARSTRGQARAANSGSELPHSTLAEVQLAPGEWLGFVYHKLPCAAILGKNKKGRPRGRPFRYFVSNLPLVRHAIYGVGDVGLLAGTICG